MGEYSEAFVAFDVAKMKHAVAIAREIAAFLWAIGREVEPL